MASRIFQRPWTIGQNWVNLVLKIVWNGTGTPTLGIEGDPKGAYVSIARTGVGTGTITTKDPYPGIVTKQVSVTRGTPAGTVTIEFGSSTHNSDGTWTIPFTTFIAGSAADLTSGDVLDFFLIFRNSSVQP